ncbi:MAG TPA: hypothetical protein DDW67_02370 [Elusimicrobia bacterium]|nr:hypothetical protein [Elusimicrobiota bacterium]
MPSNDALGLAVLDRGYHIIEDFAPRLLGGLALDEFFNYGESFLLGVLAQLSELRFYRKDLPIRFVRGLSGIKEIPHVLVLHKTSHTLRLMPVWPSRAEPALRANSATLRRA